MIDRLDQRKSSGLLEVISKSHLTIDTKENDIIKKSVGGIRNIQKRGEEKEEESYIA